MSTERRVFPAETHLDDLQADIEAGSRHIDQIYDDAAGIRDALLKRQFEQAALMGTLVRRIDALRRCIHQQRAIMRDLRHDLRTLRERG